MLQLAVVLASLLQIQAQLSPFLNSHKKDYSCYHSVSWLYNEKHHQNQFFGEYTDVLDAFYTLSMHDAEKEIHAPTLAPAAGPSLRSRPPNTQPMGSPPPNGGSRPPNAPMGSPPPGSRPPNAPMGSPPPGSPPPNAPMGSPPPGSPPPNAPMGSPPPGSRPPNAPMGSPPPGSPPPNMNQQGPQPAGNQMDHPNPSPFTNVTSGWYVFFHGIPMYDHYITQDEIDQLNARPKASTDFVSGHTTAHAGDYIFFGENIGFNAPNSCALGYWPPGPECPQEYKGENIFTLTPAPEMQPNHCYTGNQLGYFVNGIAAFDWSDANSYQSQGAWNNLAMEFERFDVDICYGHAAHGVYHHHSFSPCLAKQLKDHGQGHSPIYGFAYDGYPIMGPYQGSDLLAQSCWQRRDYQSKETGCPDGQRSCVLVDEFDFTKGIKAASMKGPGLNENLLTMSHNNLLAASGIFYEDYFFNHTCAHQGKEFLNEFNGHDHDGIGFHYHLTLDQKTKYPSFPYITGPKYYGCQPNGMICNQRPGSGQQQQQQQQPQHPPMNGTFPPLPPSNHSMPPPPPQNGSHNMSHYPPMPSQPMGPPLLSICGVPDAIPVAEQECTSDYFYFDGESSSSATSSSSSSSNGHGKRLSAGGVVGIVIAVIVVLVALLVVGIARCCGCCCFGKQARRVSFTEPPAQEQPSHSTISPTVVNVTQARSLNNNNNHIEMDAERGMVQLSEKMKMAPVPPPSSSSSYSTPIAQPIPGSYPQTSRSQSTIATSVVGNSVVAIPVPTSANHTVYL